MKKTQKGFTLVELIVVIAIIGVLAAILVPAMMGYIKDSKLTSANSSAKTIYNALTSFAQKCQNAGITIPNTQEYTDDIDVTNETGEATVAALKGSSDLVTDVQAQLSIVVNTTLNKDADGSVWRAKFNSKGFPDEVAWARSSTDIYVGCNPTQQETTTTGGIAAFTMP